MLFTSKEDERKITQHCFSFLRAQSNTIHVLLERSVRVCARLSLNHFYLSFFFCLSAFWLSCSLTSDFASMFTFYLMPIFALTWWYENGLICVQIVLWTCVFYIACPLLFLSNSIISHSHAMNHSSYSINVIRYFIEKCFFFWGANKITN